MEDGPFELSLVDAAGSVVPATAETHCRDWTEGGFRNTEILLTVRWAGGEVTGADWNYFDALCRVREQLAAFELTPQCFGACRNLVLSGMCMDMALGRQGYLVRMGQTARLENLVDIFESGPDMDLVSVAEQAEFKQQWLQSPIESAEEDDDE